MKKSLKLFAVSIAAFMTAATMAGLASCGGDDALKSDAKVTLSYWNSISGSDSEYMQNLVRDFNEDYKGEIYVENDTLLEDAHYQRILTSFTDDSTADICLVHKSRLDAFERQGRLRDMTEIVSSAEISADDYVSDVWDSGVFDDKVYALPYDVLPVVLYYNRELIPEGYTEEQIRSDDFSLELMAEMMQGTGRVQAWELHPHRADLIAAQVQRLGLENVRPMTRDALKHREELDGTMDIVLLDAPCSGLGVMSEKPDVKYRVTAQSVDELVQLQSNLLDAVCPYVKKGGTLVYSTCSVLKDENVRQAEKFLARHPEFELLPLPETIPASVRQYETTGLQLLPQRDGIEGFYMCRMRRKKA